MQPKPTVQQQTIRRTDSEELMLMNIRGIFCLFFLIETEKKNESNLIFIQKPSKQKALNIKKYILIFRQTFHAVLQTLCFSLEYCHNGYPERLPTPNSLAGKRKEKKKITYTVTGRCTVISPQAEKEPPCLYVTQQQHNTSM